MHATTTMRDDGGGWFTVGRLARIPVRVHYSVALVPVIVFRARFVPFAWVAVLFVILVHEFGHAAMVRLAGHHVTKVELHGAGGTCHWQGSVSPVWSALISWGGILAQMILYALTVAFTAATGGATSDAGAQVLSAFVGVNLFMAAFNLLPIPPLDGANAWLLFPRLLASYRRGRAARVARTTGTKRPRATHLRVVENENDSDAEDARPSREADRLIAKAMKKRRDDRAN